ncbi:MAG: HRDC domain-containing protein [Verrucomicrobiae bacterium]|nr:HRDC domain-containing protein [Verrucomicrobiae bacterium]
MTGPKYTLIAQPAELAPLLETLKGFNEVYVDMEADSMHHYREKVCLLQLSLVTGEGVDEPANYLVDPLAGVELAELFAVLQDKLLIFHGADYDLRMFRQGYGFVPDRMFDTMLAARLMNHPALGFDALVQRYAGVALDHAPQKADWAQRPLPQRMLDYAANDTRYLPRVTQRLRKELADAGRSGWHVQQCAQLVRNIAQAPASKSGDAWRVKGSSGLDRECLAILRELWKWRDAEAAEWDRPPFMVCSAERLVEWALWGQSCRGASPARLPGISPRWRPQRMRHLEEAMQRAWTLPESEWPQPVPRPRRPRPTPDFSWRMDRLREARDARARQLGLEPSILASNALLAAVAVRCPRSKQDFEDLERWLPWQTETLGEAFIEAIVERKAGD